VSACSSVGRKRLKKTKPPRGRGRKCSMGSVDGGVDGKPPEPRPENGAHKDSRQDQSSGSQKAASCDVPSHSVLAAKVNWVVVCVPCARCQGQLGTISSGGGNTALSLGCEGRVPVRWGQDAPRRAVVAQVKNKAPLGPPASSNRPRFVSDYNHEVYLNHISVLSWCARLGRSVRQWRRPSRE